MNKHHHSNYVIAAVVTVILIFMPRAAWAQPPPPLLTVEEARQAAQERMKIEIDARRATEWIDADLADVVTLYDLSDVVSGYLFPVTRSEKPAGYLTVASVAIPNPVLEFAASGPSPLITGLEDVRQRVQAQGDALLNQQHPLYVGLLGYAYELTPGQETQRILMLATGNIVEVAPLQARVSLNHLITASMQNSTNTHAPLAYKFINGVPDWNQFLGSYGCLSGCSPTAATNVIGYWDGQGYDNLINGSDWPGAVNEIRTYMGTWCTEDGGGATYRHMVSPGILEYTQAHGYRFGSHYWCGFCSTQPTYGNYRTEIDANHPMVVCVGDHSFYGSHCVTGVGYNTDGSYMIIHDGWGSTGENVNLQYGTGYSSIGMITAAPDTTRPTKATNVRPNGWSGPYTKDQTPSFVWNPAQDSGSGIAGYFVAVDDWTPDGGYSNDWWADNVTAFTVPEPLSEGEHIFAVTSKDNAGNVNPSNTNQQGDAPYYTFYIDTTAPANPTSVSSGCGAQDGVWQRECVAPAFTWEGASDHGGIGIQDYHIYWGVDVEGVPNVWRTTASYSPGVIDTSHDIITYYLRISTRDRLGHESAPKTLFSLRYDAKAPTANPVVAAGAEMVHSLRVMVEPYAEDMGSGLNLSYFSNDGLVWHSEPYAASTTWTLAPLNRTLHTIYLEVDDKVGNRSATYSRQVCLDLYPAHPSSKGYRLWSAGGPLRAGNQAQSDNYGLKSTAGQFAMGGDLSNTTYRLRSGFQALWPATPDSDMFVSFQCQHRTYLPVTLRAN